MAVFHGHFTMAPDVCEVRRPVKHFPTSVDHTCSRDKKYASRDLPGAHGKTSPSQGYPTPHKQVDTAINNHTKDLFCSQLHQPTVCSNYVKCANTQILMSTINDPQSLS